MESEKHTHFCAYVLHIQLNEIKGHRSFDRWFGTARHSTAKHGSARLVSISQWCACAPKAATENILARKMYAFRILHISLTHSSKEKQKTIYAQAPLAYVNGFMRIWCKWQRKRAKQSFNNTLSYERTHTKEQKKNTK